MQRGIAWIVDDDSSIRWVLERALTGAGLSCTTFESGNEVLDALTTKTPDVLLSDIRMPGMDGLALLKQIKQRHPMLPVIIMTAHSDLDAAVSAYQQGAFDYLPKPFDIDEAVALVDRAISHYQEQQQPRNAPISSPTADIIGEAPAMQDVFRIIGRLSRSSISVLINGESGTGKELVAHALHRHSPRSKAPFIALNMAAIPKDLIESELFGHEKGAFTGANTVRQGRFEQADGGTLFLDEIGDMPFSTQTRLLRVLANGEFFRVGGQKPIKVDVRIIAATHQNLEQLVKEGKFREDLFYRLNVIRLPLPPLRARPDDIPELIEFFMSKAATEMKTDKKQLSPDALHVMQAFNWPGNVRQLENACRWITVMATGEVLGIEDLPPDLTEFAQNYFAIKDANDHNIDNSNDINNTLSLTTSESHPAFSTTERIVPETVQTQSTDRVDTVSQRNFSTDPKVNTGPDFNTGNVASFTSAANSASQVSATNDHTIAQQSSWQNQLQTWATTALNQGKTDILQLATPEFETVLITVALEHTRGRKGEAADLLGWGRNTLTRKIKLLGIGEDNE